MSFRPVRIGTRRSPMALYQAGLVRDRLRAAHPDLAAEGAIELVPMRTTGDRVQTRLLAEIGGKGLFTKEIEEALLDRRIDLAVHSLKDMETVLPAGLEIGCVLPRDDPRDALVAGAAAGLAELPRGARIGTASLRRRAQLLRYRGDFEILPMRGNVGTRLDKLAAGAADALVLALSGLERLGKAGLASEILTPEVMLPAVGQGALAIECRAADEALRQRLVALNDPASAACVTAERAMLAALPRGARIGTASLRRRAQLLRLRDDLAILPIRGNVDTRLNKLAAGEIDALVVALCGLERLGRADVVSEILEPAVMLPAVGQGALCVECREADARVRQLLMPPDDVASAARVAAERAMLAALDGSCRTPIAGLATIAGDSLSLQGLLLSPDGDAERRGEIAGAVGDAVVLGSELGARLRRGAGPEFGFG